MKENNVLKYIQDVVKNTPTDWLKLTTHRLDIYNEELAKTEFLEQFETLFKENRSDTEALHNLPTAFDYIRLGHPLSSVLEWAVARLNDLDPENVVSFSSRTVPILAVLRKNLFDKKNTQIVYTGELPGSFDADVVKQVYGYHFELKKVDGIDSVPDFDGSTIYVSEQNEIGKVDLNPNIDFYLNDHRDLGSILIVGAGREEYIKEIQHVRRRETIAMTPANCYTALKRMTDQSSANEKKIDLQANKARVLNLSLIHI